MKTKILMSISAVALACMMVLMASPITSVTDANNGRTNGDDEFVPEFTDREVIVFSDEKFVSEVGCALIDSTSRVDSSASKTPAENTIALVDESWLADSSKGRPSTNQIKNMLYNSIPLIFVKGDSYLYKDSGIELRTGSPPSKNSVAYGLYYGPSGVVYSFECGEGMELEEALLRIYAMADDAIAADLEYSKEKESIGRAPAGPYWEQALVVLRSYPCDNKGCLNVSTTYYKLKNWNEAYTYYAIKHGQSAIPGSGTSYKVADIYLNNTLPNGHEVKDTLPVTTSGQTTSSVSFTMASEGGLSATVGWSYSISDVKTINTSIHGGKKINIWHDVSEDKNVGLGYTAYSGVEIRVGNNVNNGSLHIVDDYKVQFSQKYDKYFFGLYYGSGWNFYNHTFSVAVSISN